MPTEPQPLSDSLRATLRDAGDCHDHTPDCSCLPIRVVVDQHGHYWRDYGDNWSMCPVSTENVATEPVTEFHRAGEGGDFEMDPEKIALARLELEVEWAIQWLESGRTDQAEGDAATAARLRAALAATSTGEDWPCAADGMCRYCDGTGFRPDSRPRLAKAEPEGESHDPDYMCPNCVTPWKCNGPHIPEGEPRG